MTRVVQITDLHITAQPGSTLYGVDTARTLENVIGEIRKLPLKPDLVVATGDLVEDGSDSAYARLRSLLMKLGVPVYGLPGNHDDVSKMRSHFSVNNLHCTDMARTANWGLLFVNSQVEGHEHGYVNPAEMAKLEKNIACLDGLPLLVALHHSLSSVCPSSGCQLRNAEELTTLLNRHHNVKCVITGHTHNAREHDAGGHIQFTTPSTFAHVTHAQLGETVDHEDFWASHTLNGSIQGYRILDLQPDGAIRSEVHWVNG